VRINFFLFSFYQVVVDQTLM